MWCVVQSNSLMADLGLHSTPSFPDDGIPFDLPSPEELGGMLSPHHHSMGGAGSVPALSYPTFQGGYNPGPLNLGAGASGAGATATKYAPFQTHPFATVDNTAAPNPPISRATVTVMNDGEDSPTDT